MIAAPQNPSSRLVLASSSPRRRDLLAQAGYAFDVACPPLEEPTRWPDDLPPRALAEALAYFKARCVAEDARDARIIGADTICACNGRIMGKPADADHAREMLHELSHNRHAVITGVAVIEDQQRRITSATTWVTMTPMTPEDIEDYIASGEWQGKAGAYAIQESADRYVERLDGSFSNVVGLPMELLATLIGPADGEGE
jgi:septum formation protein